VAGPVALGVAALVVAAGLFLVMRSDRGPDLVVLESVDYTTEPERLVGSDERWTAEVAEGALQIRAAHPGAVQLPWVESDPAAAIAVEAAFAWPDAVSGDELYIGGLMALGADGSGWGVACGTDGNGYVLAVLPGQSQALDVVPGVGCERPEFDLALRVDGVDGTDTLDARLPDGHRITLKPGPTRGPYAEAGFLAASGDRTMTVPGIDVTGYRVLVAE
jgi:hypothetical protein